MPTNADEGLPLGDAGARVVGIAGTATTSGTVDVLRSIDVMVASVSAGVEVKEENCNEDPSLEDMVSL